MRRRAPRWLTSRRSWLSRLRRRALYEKYKHVLKVNAHQVARKNAEAWRSFFSLVKEKKEGKLPRLFKPRSPGYRKGKGGKYRLMIIIRNDRYVVDENERTIYLKDFKLSLKFKGRLKWHGKQSKLEIAYNEARRSWYAHILVEVENTTGESGGDLRASVDLGLLILQARAIGGDIWAMLMLSG